MTQPALGIDVGGSGIKAGFVDIETGQLIGERFKVDTPIPSTPEAVAETLRDLIKGLNWHGEKIGCGFPTTIDNGVALLAANIDKGWLGVHIASLFESYTGHKYYVINDADAAGLAERMYGRIKDEQGTVLMLTLGTGIGSALFYNGVLVPNTEFGHLLYRDSIAENYVSNRARKERMLEYDTWAAELAEFLDYTIRLLSPRMIVLGGGVSFRFDDFSRHFEHLRVPVVNAMMYNDAGIIGAAAAAFPEMIEKYG